MSLTECIHIGLSETVKNINTIRNCTKGNCLQSFLFKSWKIRISDKFVASTCEGHKNCVKCRFSENVHRTDPAEDNLDKCEDCRAKQTADVVVTCSLCYFPVTDSQTAMQASSADLEQTVVCCAVAAITYIWNNKRSNKRLWGIPRYRSCHSRNK